MTKDGVLVARHENEISSTTDVAAHQQFADRQRMKVIDGQEVIGWTWRKENAGRSGASGDADYQLRQQRIRAGEIKTVNKDQARLAVRM